MRDSADSYDPAFGRVRKTNAKRRRSGQNTGPRRIRARAGPPVVARHWTAPSKRRRLTGQHGRRSSMARIFRVQLELRAKAIGCAQSP